MVGRKILSNGKNIREVKQNIGSGKTTFSKKTLTVVYSFRKIYILVLRRYSLKRIKPMRNSKKNRSERKIRSEFELSTQPNTNYIYTDNISKM